MDPNFVKAFPGSAEARKRLGNFVKYNDWFWLSSAGPNTHGWVFFKATAVYFDNMPASNYDPGLRKTLEGLQAEANGTADPWAEDDPMLNEGAGFGLRGFVNDIHSPARGLPYRDMRGGTSWLRYLCARTHSKPVRHWAYVRWDSRAGSAAGALIAGNAGAGSLGGPSGLGGYGGLGAALAVQDILDRTTVISTVPSS